LDVKFSDWIWVAVRSRRPTFRVRKHRPSRSPVRSWSASSV